MAQSVEAIEAGMRLKTGKGTVGFVHTTPATIGMADAYMRSYLPGTAIVHMYDGTVKIENFKSPIGVTPKSNLLKWAVSAEQLEREGCDVIVSCCSLMPRATAFARQVVSVPFVQLDAVILDEAAERCRRIGVVTTTDYSAPYVEEGLKTRAASLGKEIEIVFSTDSRALDFFNAGDFDKHDEIVLDLVRGLMSAGVDCVLMGQIPFALMEEKLKDLNSAIPVLYAGPDAFRHIEELLAGSKVV